MKKSETTFINRAVLNPRTLSFLVVGAGILGIVATMVPTLLAASLPTETFYAALVLTFGVCLALLLVVLWQRRAHLWTHLALLGGAGCIVALFWLRPGGFGNVFIIFFILGGSVAMPLPLPQALLWGASLYLLTLLNSWLAFGYGGLLGWYGSIGAYIFFGVFGYILQQADVNFRRNVELYDELREAHGQLRRYAQQEQHLAVAEERNRLAREMHDSLGHQLTVVMMQLEGAQRVAPDDPERAAELTASVRRQLKEAMNELRHLLYTLRTAPEHSGNGALGIVASLEQLVQTFALATGLDVTFQLAAQTAQPTPPLSSEVAQAFYRTVQEGLTNVHRHASAERAWVTLELGGVLRLRVDDDGVGLGSSAEGSFGLIGLRERAAALGGTLTLEARSGGGTSLCFEVASAHPEQL